MAFTLKRLLKKISALDEAVTVCGTVKKLLSSIESEAPIADNRRLRVFNEILKKNISVLDTAENMVSYADLTGVDSDSLLGLPSSILTATEQLVVSSSSSPSSDFSGMVTEPFLQLTVEEAIEPDL